MTIEKIPFENRFLIQSGSRRDIKHLLDLDSGMDELCSCWQSFCKGERFCKHVRRLIPHERQRLAKLGIKV